MDCRTAHLLIEAFHDDELEVVEAASLLAHLDACPDCARRHEAARRLRSVFRESRPVVECPEALKRKLARRVEPSRRFPRVVPQTVTICVLAAGLGLLAGEAFPVRGRFDGSVPAGSPLAEVPVTQRVSGEVFCLRCALERLFPGSSFAAAPHRPVLHTADGRLFTILPGEQGTLLSASGCSGRRVDVLARLYPRSGLAAVVTVNAGGPAASKPAVALAQASR